MYSGRVCVPVGQTVKKRNARRSNRYVNKAGNVVLLYYSSRIKFSFSETTRQSGRDGCNCLAIKMKIRCPMTASSPRFLISVTSHGRGS